MLFNLRKWPLYFILLILLACSKQGFFNFRPFLETPPKYGINDKKPNYYRAHAGVFPYIYHQGKTYILLGQEKESGDWSEFGGKCNKKDKNFLTTLRREFYEETAGLYDLKVEDFKKSDTYYLYQDKPDRKMEVVYAFVKVHTLIDGGDLNDAQRFRENLDFLEKKNVTWIDVEDLLYVMRQPLKNTKKLHVKVLDGSKQTLNVRRFFYEDFISHPALQALLEELLKHNHQDLAKAA